MSMTFGWTGRIILINLTNGEIRDLDTMKYAEKFVGGRGIAAAIAWEIIPSGIDAFDPNNPLIAMTGPLTGTLAPTSGRIVFCSVSPRVYPKPWYTHSTMGGFFGSELKYAGFDGLVIIGQSKVPVYLWIHDKKIDLVSADQLWGKTVWYTVKKLRSKHGRGIHTAAIGPAGENLVRYAVISHPPENASGHSGFGAVMGHKKLKAIAIKGTTGIGIANPDLFVKTCKYAMEISYSGAPGFLVNGDYEYPVPATRPVCTQSCSVNCRLGQIYFNTPRTLSEGEPIKARQAFCIGPIWLMNEPMSEYEGGGIRIPPITGWLPAEGGVELHILCDDLGIDLWSLLTFQPWFARCIELGINQLEGLELKPRDAEWFYKLLHLIAYRKGYGDLLAEDLRRVADRLRRKIPQELIKLAETLEFAYGFPAHREGRVWDPEPLPFWLVSALMYASESRDPTICAHSSFMHLAELFIDNKKMFLKKMKPISARLWGSEKVFEPNFENKIQLAMWCQHRHIMLDCLPMCDFSFPRVLKSFRTKKDWERTEDVFGDLDIEAQLFSACTGLQFETSDLEKTAERVFNLERMILVEKHGRTREIDETVAPHFQLPCNTDGTSITLKEFKSLLDDYYTQRGWDSKTGKPFAQKLKELGL